MRSNGGISGTRLNSNVSWQRRKSNLDVFVRQLFRHVHLALCSISVGLENEHRAICLLTRRIRALINRILQDIISPSADEISMMSVASGIALGKYELASFACEGIGVPDDLEEKHGHHDWMICWTWASLDTRWVDDVALVICRIKVLAIPAAGKHEFGANTIGALLLDEGCVS